MDDNGKQTALALQPDLIQIVLDLAVNAQIVNQKVSVLRQPLLMQADMAVRIDVDDGKYMIALGDKLSSERAGAVRQIQQDPLVVPLFFQGLQRQRELRKQALIRGFILAFRGLSCPNGSRSSWEV